MMAPEMLELFNKTKSETEGIGIGRGYSYAIDYYAIGILLYEMLIG
jgi:serine/threonine protein kinase